MCARLCSYQARHHQDKALGRIEAAVFAFGSCDLFCSYLGPHRLLVQCLNFPDHVIHSFPFQSGAGVC